MGHLSAVASLAQDLIRLDSRSRRSNYAVADRLQGALPGFELEHLDYNDPDGTPKRVLVAVRGHSGLALSGHMDTVPDTGWTTDPWSGRIEGDILHGLGATDMKGPVAAIVAAACTLPHTVPVALFLTTDEETTKAGARAIVQRSALARRFAPRGIVVAEPTSMAPVRGHRSHIEFIATAHGVQAHSSTGRGRNANWDLLPFLQSMRAVHDRLRADPALQDPDYDPPFSDFNLVLDNHGTAINVSVPRATARIKFRYSASVDPTPILAAVRAAAAGVELVERHEAPPPELPPGHPLIGLAERLSGAQAGTAPYGTDASELQALAPCVILGPGSIELAHKPGEHVSLSALASAVPVFMQMAEHIAA